MRLVWVFVCVFFTQGLRADCLCTTPQIERLIKDTHEAVHKDKAKNTASNASFHSQEAPRFNFKKYYEPFIKNDTAPEPLRIIPKPFDKIHAESDTPREKQEAEPIKIDQFIVDGSYKKHLFYSMVEFNPYGTVNVTGYERRFAKRDFDDIFYPIYRLTKVTGLSFEETRRDIKSERRKQFGVKWQGEDKFHTFLMGLSSNNIYQYIYTENWEHYTQFGLALNYEQWWNIDENWALQTSASLNRATKVTDIYAQLTYKYVFADDLHLRFGVEGKMAKYHENGALKLGLTVSDIPFLNNHLRVFAGVDHTINGKTGKFFGLALWRER